MRRIAALWESFYSKRFYSDVFRSWRGIGASLIFVLVLLETVAATVMIFIGMGTFARDIAPAMIAQVPTIQFKDGKATTPEPVRHEVKDPQSGMLVAIIDTSVSVPPSDLGGAAIFVAGERLTIQNGEGQQRSFDYREFPEGTLDQNILNEWLRLLETYLAPICAPFILFFLMIARMVQLFFFSLITMALGNITQLQGSYPAKLRLTAAGLTPAIVLSIVCTSLGIRFTGSGLAFCAIVIVYLIFGIRSAWNTPPPLEVPQHG